MSGGVAGADYVRAIEQHESDRRAREAFQSLALAHVPPGGTIFDFGAGPGIDARFFAGRGLCVRVYDNDARMRHHLAETCRDAIDAGRIVPETSTESGSEADSGTDPEVDDYGGVLARKPEAAAPRAHLVIADFAPLNLVADLPPLFARLHALTVPGAGLLASVLSPYFLGDLKYGWRWGGMLGQWRTGKLIVRGARGDIIRRCLPLFAADCAPWFRLERAFRGLPPRNAAQAAGIDLALHPRTAWLRLTRCRYMFLLFRRLPS